MTIEEIKELAKQYGVEVNLVGTNTIFLKSLNNTWFFYLDNLKENLKNRKNKIYLFHHSNGNEKQHFHCQRKYGKITDVFDSISTHDIHMFKERKKSRMEMLFEKIDNEKNDNNKLHKNKINQNKKHKIVS